MSLYLSTAIAPDNIRSPAVFLHILDSSTCAIMLRAWSSLQMLCHSGDLQKHGETEYEWAIRSQDAACAKFVSRDLRHIALDERVRTSARGWANIRLRREHHIRKVGHALLVLAPE